MNKITVNCFVASTTSKNLIKINTLHKIFGNNIPNYLHYEGGTGMNYLCCVKNDIDVIEICNEHNYKINYLYKMEIDENIYNDLYTVHPTYNKDGEKYKLEKKINLLLFYTRQNIIKIYRLNKVGVGEGGLRESSAANIFCSYVSLSAS